MVAVVRTNTAEAGAKRRFLSVGTFEHAQTDSGWEFRPNEGSARRLATLHAGCLTLLAIVVLEATGLSVGLWVVFSFVDSLRNDWFTLIVGIGSALILIGSTPLLVAWARLSYRKSLQENWLTLRIAPGGPIQFGETILVEAGRARHIVVRTRAESDGEGGTTVSYRLEVVQDRECAAPVHIPIPRYGWWETSVGDKQTIEVFAQMLAGVLGSSSIQNEQATDSKPP